jgi:eukaryotic-like serine/threonine-protein kinase
MIGKTLGHYRVGEQLGRGGMGEVYIADDLNLNRKVALKFLPDAFATDPERMARFEREAKLLASLNHTNIAAIYGLEQAEGKRFLVLELVEGETLAQRISKGALPLEEALAICRQIAEGLEAAHEKGVIHRDLKPANVMITEGEKVKILDFGLAKALSDETQSVDSSQSPTLTEAMTRPGVILGTAAYMSPEQAKGKRVDKRADIWAFGCILYECLTGNRAFEGETVTETLAAVLTKEPEWEKVPAKAHPLLRRCLEKDPKNRLRDIGDTYALLEAAPETAPAEKNRSWIGWTVAAVFVIAFAVLSLIHFREEPLAPAESVRFQIQYPEKLNSGNLGPFAISPDGRDLAFAAIGSDGSLRIWLRALDSLKAHPLEGAQVDSSQPPFFWSPDSRFIAFDSGGKLKKIEVSGAPPQTICSLSSLAVGGSWNRDGVIIFGTMDNGIMSVSDSGGAVSQVTKPNPTRQERMHTFPVFLPDGRHFLYLCDSSNPEYSGIYIGALDPSPGKGDSKPLITTRAGAVYMPSKNSSSGHLLFLRDQMLMAQRFDDSSLKLMGDPVHVVEQVGSNWEYGFFSASMNGALIYRQSVENQLVWIDRSGRELTAIGEPGNYPTFDLSKDATRLVVSRAQADGRLNLWLMDMLRGQLTPLTLGNAEHTDPRWLTNGRQVIFVIEDDSKFISQVSLPDSKPTKIYKLGNTSCGLDDVSPDGRHLLYHLGGPELWALPLADRGKPTLVASSLSGFIDQARFSPDGRWIAFNTNESGRHEVKVIAFPPTNEKWQISRTGGVQPMWKGDGREMYFLSPDGTLMSVDVQAGRTFQFGTPRTLFKTQLSITDQTEQYAPAPDGKSFLVAQPAAESTTSPFTVILNWTSLLKK